MGLLIRTTAFSLWFMLCFLANLCSAQGDNRPIAFPGAEGFGKYVTGGRGGQVIKVTNLNNAGPGSFRNAVEKAGPRIIVFEVSGNIFLNSAINLLQNDVTIAGQTAPGEGVTITNYPFNVKANNVIIRYLRFRMSDAKNVEADAIGGFELKDVIVDHCSMSWSTDECVSFYNNDNFTMQWCIIAESLRASAHAKGAHGYGGIWGGKNASFHHNLMANHDSRNPRFGERDGSAYAHTDLVDVRNNVFYNWGNNSAYGGEAMHINIINNYYKPGPATKVKNRIFSIDKYLKKPESPIYNQWGKFYISGNEIEGDQKTTNDNWTYGVFAHFNSRYGKVSESEKKVMQLAVPLETHKNITTQSAKTAYGLVLQFAGAVLTRDSIDHRIVAHTKKGSFTAHGSSGQPSSRNGIIDKASDVGGLAQLKTTSPPLDTDGDGMPDEWEKRHQLDPKKTNANARELSKAYDNIEIYINSLVKNITGKAH